MATFPAKTNYAAGNVLTAAQMVDIGDQLNALNKGAGRNVILNSDFRIAQRGTSFSNPSDGAYTLDRWKVAYNGSGATHTVSQQTFTPGAAPVAGYEGANFLRWAVTVNGTSNTYRGFQQPIEDVRTFAGQTVTLSLWMKADTNRTIDSVKFSQVFGSGGSATVDTSMLSGQSITSSWVRYSATVTLPSISGKTIGTNSNLLLQIFGPANAASTFDIWGVQVESGNVATAFQTATGTLAGEVLACQRYYFRWTAGDAYTPFGMALKTTATAASWVLQFPVEMRARVTSLEFSSLMSSNAAGNGAITAMTLGWWGKNTARIDITNNSVGVADTPTLIQSNNNSSAYFAINAEL